MIGYYVHHHGSGHATRAALVSRYIGADLVGFGSGGRPTGWAGGPWFDLPADIGPGDHDRPHRNGAWHWLPAGNDGLRERMGALASWIHTVGPAAFVVDVSVEVTVLVALLGVPTAMVLLPGNRSDRPHRLALDSADLILAPWAAGEAVPGSVDGGDRLVSTGGFGRFDGRSGSGSSAIRSKRVVMFTGTGGLDLPPKALATVVSRTPDWDWHLVGSSEPVHGATVHGRVADPWPLLCSAEVVVTACGDASLSEVAAAARPALLMPQDRPFEEQQLAASGLLGRAPVGLAPDLSEPRGWDAALTQVSRLDGKNWAGLYDGGGGMRFARAVMDLADRSRSTPAPPFDSLASVGRSG